MIENWRPVVGFEGLYDVSDLGNVRSVERTMPWGRHQRRVPPRMLKAYVNQERGHYRYVNLHRDGQHMCRIARIVTAAFHGEPLPGYVACHINGDRQDDRAENLRWGSAKDNCADMLRHGTRPRGERHGNARLKVGDVAAIRATDENRRVLAARFGVDAKHIDQIRAGRRW